MDYYFFPPAARDSAPFHPATRQIPQHQQVGAEVLHAGALEMEKDMVGGQKGSKTGRSDLPAAVGGSKEQEGQGWEKV